jgi:hypothetical protein
MAVFLVSGVLIAFNLGGVSGCGGGTTDGDGATTATDEDAESSGSAAVTTAGAALETVLENSAPALAVAGLRTGLTSGRLKSAISVVETTLGCVENDLPVVSGSLFSGTLNGTALSPDGSGSCTVNADGTVSASAADVDVVLSCDNFNGGSETDNVFLDGSLGFFAVGTFSGSTISIAPFNIGSEALTITFDGTTCDLVIGIDGSATFNTDTETGEVSVSGCLTLCGQDFTAVGTVAF